MNVKQFYKCYAMIHSMNFILKNYEQFWF